MIRLETCYASVLRLRISRNATIAMITISPIAEQPSILGLLGRCGCFSRGSGGVAAASAACVRNRRLGSRSLGGSGWCFSGRCSGFGNRLSLGSGE